MRIGLVGYGSIGARHAQLLRAYTKQIVVLSQRKDVPAPFTTVHDWKSFQKAGPFDVIFVTDETGTRMGTVKKCAALAPRALFIEKPLAMNARDAKRIQGLIKRARISAWVGYCLQWSEPLIRAKKTIDSGTLGRIHSVRVFVGQDLRTWRTRDYRKSYSTQAARGGGVLLDLIHEINYPAWLLGETLVPKAAVLAHDRRLKTDAETLVESVCVTRSGVVVQIHQDCVRSPALRSFEIAGSKGTLQWDSQSRPATGDMYKKQLAAFFRMLRSGKRFSNIEEAVQDLRVVDRIRALAA